jgi:hypothetical protein
MKKTLLFVSAFALCITAFSQIPNYVPLNGLGSWYSFDGNANDLTVNGNNGALNGVTSTIGLDGNMNTAYHFNGNGNTIQLLNPFLNGVQVQEFSLEFLVKFDTVGVTQVLWAKSLFWGEISIALTVNNNIQMVWANSVTGNKYSSIYSNPNLINVGEWYNIVIVFQNSGGNIYINGNQVSTNLQWTAQGGSVLSTSQIESQANFAQLPNSSAFGSYQNTYFFKGKMDEFGIWNRALTPCEIIKIYNRNVSFSLVSAGADQSICAGDNVTLSGAGGSNYQWNNNVVDGQAFAPAQSNAYVVTAQDSLGCIGIDTVVVTILENATSTLTETSLDSYTLNGQTYTQSGTYTQTLTAANGCDSTVTLNLTLNFTGIDELGTNAKKLVKITDLNGKTIPRRKNTLMLFIYEDGTVERVMEMEE